MATGLKGLLRRSPAELRYRLRQESSNLWLLAARPSLPPGTLQRPPLRSLPDITPVLDRLRGTSYALEVERLAAEVLAHRFPLFGRFVDTDDSIPWRRDCIHGVESALAYHRLIPYLDFRRVGDHKVVWELNRHQHLVLLAQAFRLTERRAFFDEIIAQLESWFASNPFLRGMNWVSALEVALRALSWTWVYHLTGAWMEPAFQRRFLSELYRHGLYIERNLSIYFSPNTHLLGEAVALHAIGASFSVFPTAAKWEKYGAEMTLQQMQSQVLQDGVHFERSTYYHLYALDFFLFHRLLLERLGKQPPEWFCQKLVGMAEYVHAILGSEGILELIGDDDGGRVFHPYGPCKHFGRDTLATAAMSLGQGKWSYAIPDIYPQAAWWVGEAAFQVPPDTAGEQPRVSRLFPDAGVAVLTAGQARAIVDVGAFGPGGAGHSHSDTLSLVARFGRQRILIDSGTFTYVTDADWRNRFRGSAAHNTVRVDGKDQATATGAFRWENKPKVCLDQWSFAETQDYLDATACYSGIIHRRRILFLKPDLLFILDEIDGPPGEHLLEQFWHVGLPSELLSSRCLRIGSCARLLIAPGSQVDWIESGEHAWLSPVLGQKELAQVLRIHMRTTLPASMAALLELSEVPTASDLQLDCRRDQVLLRAAGSRSRMVAFPAVGMPAHVLPVS